MPGDERDDDIDLKTLVRELREFNAGNRAEHETFRDALKTYASRSEMQVAIEGVHDHIRMVAEGASGQNEAVVRRLDAMQRSFDEMQRGFDVMQRSVDEMQRSVDELRGDNLSQHKTLLNVLGDHQERISAIERRSE